MQIRILSRSQGYHMRPDDMSSEALTIVETSSINQIFLRFYVVMVSQCCVRILKVRVEIDGWMDGV